MSGFDAYWKMFDRAVRGCTDALDDGDMEMALVHAWVCYQLSLEIVTW